MHCITTYERGPDTKTATSHHHLTTPLPSSAQGCPEFGEKPKQYWFGKAASQRSLISLGNGRWGWVGGKTFSNKGIHATLVGWICIFDVYEWQNKTALTKGSYLIVSWAVKSMLKCIQECARKTKLYPVHLTKDGIRSASKSLTWHNATGSDQEGITSCNQQLTWKQCLSVYAGGLRHHEW